jgi:hypothetical protein
MFGSAEKNRGIVKEESMSKEAAVCPFSRRMCKECAIYWGRHFELCSLRNFRLREARAAKAKAWSDEVFTKWDMPEIPDGTNIMVDIEDFIERRGI